jgi:hypothetical protein
MLKKKKKVLVAVTPPPTPSLQNAVEEVVAVPKIEPIRFDFDLDLRGLTKLDPQIMEYQGKITGFIRNSKQPTVFVPFNGISVEFFRRDGRELKPLVSTNFGFPWKFWEAAIPAISAMIEKLKIKELEARAGKKKKKKLGLRKKNNAF